MLLVTASLCKRATDPWSIRPPGVVWEFIARTKTAGGHLYWGTKEDGSEISAPGRIAGDVPTRHLGPDP